MAALRCRALASPGLARWVEVVGGAPPAPAARLRLRCCFESACVHGAEGIGVCQGVVMPGGVRVQAICWWCGCSWLVGWLDVWVLPCPPSAVAGPTTVVFPSP